MSAFDGKIQLACNLPGGSSGGPWVYQYDDNIGLGYFRGVMRTLNSSSGVNKSPYFGDAVKAMFDSVANVT